MLSLTWDQTQSIIAGRFDEWGHHILEATFSRIPSGAHVYLKPSSKEVTTWLWATSWRISEDLMLSKKWGRFLRQGLEHIYTLICRGTYQYWYGKSQYVLELAVLLDSDSGSSLGLSGKPGPHRWARCDAPETAGVWGQNPRDCADCCMSSEILLGKKKIMHQITALGLPVVVVD